MQWLKNSAFSKEVLRYLVSFLFFMVTLPSQAQNLSFTLQQDTVNPGSQLTLVNTSTNVPVGSHFRFSFSNGSIRLDQFIGADLEQYLFNGDTLVFSVSPFDSTFNQQYFSIKLELTDEERDALYYEILLTREYDELMEEYRMYDEEYLYTLLASDTNLLWLGGENDEEYRDFYDSVKGSNANRFYDIEKLIDSQVYFQALDELMELEPKNTIEVNLKTAYHIYLNSWALGRFELTQGEVDTLAEIALQLPYAGGRGVYTARIMLGIEPFENELAYRTSSPNTGKKTLFAYPNPAGQMVTFRFDEIPDKETAVIEIHSIGGKMVLSVRVQSLETEYTTALNNLPNGIYLVRIKYANGDQASVKLVKYQ